MIVGLGLPLAALPVTILAVDPGRAWSWRIAAVEMEHVVAPDPAGGCEITLTMRAPAALELALQTGYAPIAGAMVRRLAAVAAR